MASGFVHGDVGEANSHSGAIQFLGAALGVHGDRAIISEYCAPGAARWRRTRPVSSKRAHRRVGNLAAHQRPNSCACWQIDLR